jgi:hypothetical protein
MSGYRVFALFPDVGWRPVSRVFEYEYEAHEWGLDLAPLLTREVRRVP